MKNTKEIVVPKMGSCRGTPRAFVRVVSAVALLAPLSGCFFDTAQWSAIESPKNNTVEWIKFDHKVKFDDVGARLTLQERRRLSKFLGDIRTTRRDDIVVIAPNMKGAVRDQALAARRIASVKALIEGTGLSAYDGVPGRGSKEWDGTIQVVVGRYVVIAPKCPDWTKPAASDWTNAASSNHGCATTTNLGLMVADPGDLVRSRQMTPSDGQAGAAKVDKYRKGTTPKATASASGGK